MALVFCGSCGDWVFGDLIDVHDFDGTQCLLFDCRVCGASVWQDAGEFYYTKENCDGMEQHSDVAE